MTWPPPALARHLAVPGAWPLTLSLGAWLGEPRQDRARYEPTLTKLAPSCSAPRAVSVDSSAAWVLCCVPGLRAGAACWVWCGEPLGVSQTRGRGTACLQATATLVSKRCTKHQESTAAIPPFALVKPLRTGWPRGPPRAGWSAAFRGIMPSAIDVVRRFSSFSSFSDGTTNKHAMI